jgi:hypothetical protein
VISTSSLRDALCRGGLDTDPELYFVEYLPLLSYSRLEEAHIIRENEHGEGLLTPKNLARAWIEANPTALWTG